MFKNFEWKGSKSLKSYPKKTGAFTSASDIADKALVVYLQVCCLNHIVFF